MNPADDIVQFKRLYAFYDERRDAEAYRRVITTISDIKESEGHLKNLAFIQYLSSRPDDGRPHGNARFLTDPFKRKDTKSLKSKVLEMKKTKSPQETYAQLSQEEDEVQRPRDMKNVENFYFMDDPDMRGNCADEVLKVTSAGVLGMVIVKYCYCFQLISMAAMKHPFVRDVKIVDNLLPQIILYSDEVS